MDKLYVDNNILIGVDLGSNQITVMAARVHPQTKEVEVLGVEKSERRGLAVKGIIKNFSETASELVHLCRLLKNSASLTELPQTIFVSLGGSGLKFTTAEVERNLEPQNHVSKRILCNMETECVTKMENNYPGISVAEVIWGSFLLDGRTQSLDPLDKRAKNIKGTYEVYYGPRQMRYNWDECIKTQDQLSIGSYFVNTEAWRVALLTDDDEQEGCAIINFGSDTTTFCAYYQGKLIDLIVVPFGSHNITKDIAYKATSIGDAEKLKRRFTYVGEAPETTTIRVNSAIEPGADIFFTTDSLNNIATRRATEIFEPIIEHIEENIDILRDKTLYVTGGGARQKGLINFLRENIEMDVKVGTPANKLTENTDPKYSMPEYTQLVGTIILASDFVANEVVSTSPKQSNKKKKSGENKFSFIKTLFSDTSNNDFQDEE